MCQIVTTLIELDPYRRIQQCEHGTISLYWNAAAWFFEPCSFRKLSQRLELARRSPLETTRLHQFACVFHAERVRIWFGEAGFNLSKEDFERFATMVLQSLPRMFLYAQVTSPLSSEERKRQLLESLN